MRSLRPLFVSCLIFGSLLVASEQGLAIPSSVIGASVRDCRALLSVSPDGGRVTRLDVPGTTQTIWTTLQKDTYKGDIRQVRLAAVHVAPGAAMVRPFAAGIPLLTQPRQIAQRRGVIAVTNGDYFEALRTADSVPEGALVSKGKLLYSPTGWSEVIAVDDSGTVFAGRVRTKARYRVAERAYAIHSVNYPRLSTGEVTVFTSAWSRTFLPSNLWMAHVEGGVVVSLRSPRSGVAMPKSGVVISSPTREGLAGLGAGVEVKVTIEPKSKHQRPLTFASGHGGLVLKASVVERICSPYENLLRPRTLIGWNDKGDVWFIVASSGLPDPEDGVRRGGATKMQMAAFARSIGATNAAILDGGGSTVLLTHDRGRVQRLDLPTQAWVRPVPTVWAVVRD